MRIVVAPDKFKGTLSAEQAARAIAAGVLRARPDAEVLEIPMADGGEGTLDAMLSALGGRRLSRTVAGPLGDPTHAEFGMADGSPGPLGIVEMAAASGLSLVPARRRDPRRTSTRGTGELILAAAQEGARRLLVCIGGSSTNDGGAGMAQALGVRLLDERGRDIGPGGAALLELATIDMRGMRKELSGVEFVVANDVDNPLVGPSGAAAIYGPQKGASPEDVILLDGALRHFAAVVHRDLGVDVRYLPGGGAAGGLGAGLVCFLGARLRPGVQVVIEAVGLRERMKGAALVISGEGSFDRQSLAGKVPAGVLRLAEDLGVPAVLLCGRSDEGSIRDGVQVETLAGRFGVAAAMSEPALLLERLAAEVVSRLGETG